MIVWLMTMHLNLFSLESTRSYMQNTISAKLKTAQRLVNEKKYDLAIGTLKSVRREAVSSENNDYMALIYQGKRF